MDEGNVTNMPLEIAATIIQAFFRATSAIRKADPRVRSLRVTCLLRARLAKARLSLCLT